MTAAERAAAKARVRQAVIAKTGLTDAHAIDRFTDAVCDLIPIAARAIAALPPDLLTTAKRDAGGQSSGWPPAATSTGDSPSPTSLPQEQP